METRLFHLVFIFAIPDHIVRTNYQLVSELYRLMCEKYHAYLDLTALHPEIIRTIDLESLS